VGVNLLQNEKNVINLLPDGEVELRFYKPVKLDLGALFLFGNINGVLLIVDGRNRIQGLKFRDKRVLKLFFEMNAPEKLREIMRIVEEMEKEK
jgi:hypothetical protein